MCNKGTVSLTLVSFERVLLLKYACQIWSLLSRMAQKLWPMLTCSYIVEKHTDRHVTNYYEFVQKYKSNMGRYQVSRRVILLACNIRRKCSMGTSRNSLKAQYLSEGHVLVLSVIAGRCHCILSSFRMPFNTRERGTSYLFNKFPVSAIQLSQWRFQTFFGVSLF